MSFNHRLAIVIATVVIFSVGLAGCGPSTPGPFTVAEAQKREQAGRRQDALLTYDAIVRQNQQSNKDLAADALYKAGEYASNPERYGTTPELRIEGQDRAWQHWKQLRDEFPEQAKKLLHLDEPDDKLAALRDTIDKRNSGDWKYQLIDGLVRLTGKNPSFSYGFALILLAVLVKVLLFPLARKQYKSQREMQQLQPKIKELQAQYKGKGVELNQKTMELYKEHGVNPFGSCLPTLFQLPFLIFVYSAIREYEQAFSHGKFLWIGSDLARQHPGVLGMNLALPDIPLLVMYTLTNYVTMRMTPAADPQQQQQQNSMALMTSGMFFYMFLNYRWSSAFVLYWLALNILSIWQTYVFVYKPHKERMQTAATVPATEKSKNGTGPAATDAKKIAPMADQPQPARVKPRKKKK
jgi:YidC/Oxa1 family membrane protein insertase